MTTVPSQPDSRAIRGYDGLEEDKTVGRDMLPPPAAGGRAVRLCRPGKVGDCAERAAVNGEVRLGKC